MSAIGVQPSAATEDCHESGATAATAGSSGLVGSRLESGIASDRGSGSPRSDSDGCSSESREGMLMRSDSERVLEITDFGGEGLEGFAELVDLGAESGNLGNPGRSGRRGGELDP